MANVSIGLCRLELYLPALSSLKEKRGILKSLLARLHNQFNVSAAELDHQDVWQSSVIAIACVSNSQVHCHQVLQSAIDWIEENFPEIQIVEEEFEIL